MKPTTDTHPHLRSTGERLLWPALLLLFGLRLLYIPLSGLGLFFDEAYYHFWSLTPDWGYYSKPPMVAWLIALTTGLFGSTQEWAVKLGAPLCYLGTCWLLFDLARRLFDARAARYTALIFATLPLVSFNSLFITTDAPLMLFWALTLRLFVAAREQDRLWPWLLAGIAGGLGLLSKYTMGVLAVGLLAYLLADRDNRRLLAHPGLWLATATAALVFLPNLYWNWQHDFISFQHTREISHLEGKLVHLDSLVEFLAGQFLVFGPVAMGLLVLLCVRPPRSDGERLLLFTSLPMLAVIALQAFLARANVNWAAPAYVSATPLVACWLARRRRTGLLGALLGLNLLLGLAIYGYQPLQRALEIEPTKRNNPFHRVDGWGPLMREIPRQIALPADADWLSDSRKLLSYLHFYLGAGQARPRGLWSFNRDGHISDHFALLYDLKDSPQHRFVFVSDSPRTFAGCFGTSRPLGEVSYQLYPTLQRRLYLYLVEDFQGYAHCDTHHP